MTISIVGTTIEILGKPYQIKCPESEIQALQKAALFLEDKMREVRSVTQVLSIDRIAVIAALNLSHQLLSIEQAQLAVDTSVEQRLQLIDDALRKVLPPSATKSAPVDDQMNLSQPAASEWELTSA